MSSEILLLTYSVVTTKSWYGWKSSNLVFSWYHFFKLNVNVHEKNTFIGATGGMIHKQIS